jgi:uncharacterized protein YbbK (DUF523 family)
MSVKNKKIKDKTKYVYNFDTDLLDVVDKFNVDRIVTAERNPAGTKNMIYDPASGTHIESGPTVVIDNEGHVIVVGR